MADKGQSKHQKTTLSKTFSLKDDFPVPSYEAWREVVEPFLKGVSFEKKLCTRTYEGITLQPIYTRKDRETAVPDNYPGGDKRIRGKSPEGYVKNPWDVARELPYALAETFNKALLNDLQKGQNTIVLRLDTATLLGQDADYARAEDVGDRGLSISGLRSLERALDKVDLSAVTLTVDGGFSALPFLSVLNAYMKKHDIQPSTLRGAIPQDPLAFLASKGYLPFSFSHIYREIREVLGWLRDYAPQMQGVGISTLPYHDGGANAVQELAWTLSTLVDWMDQAKILEMTPEKIARQLHITFGTGPFFFMEIAKFRAARVLIRNVLKAYGAESCAGDVTFFARPSRTNQTLYDPYTNILRTTTEAFSAVLGGVDSLHTNCFDEMAVDEPTAFSRRVARNIQIILRDECHLDRLIDPVGGSYFVETLTRQLAKDAWLLFQKTEAAGGIKKALNDGWIQQEIQTVRETREKDLRKRKQVLVGLNMYADIKQKKLKASPVDHEALQKKRAEYLKSFRVSKGQKEDQEIMKSLESLSVEKEQCVETTGKAILAGATLGEISRSLRISAEDGAKVTPVPLFRASEIFEKFRDRGWEAEKSKSGRPKILLVNMGPPRQHKVRSDFSRGFLEPGGFKVLETPNQSTPEEAARTASESGAFAAVICSTDETYPEIVPAFIKKIRELKSPLKVIVAGRPKENLELLEKAGVDRFLYLGADAVEFYETLWKQAGGEAHA